MTRYFILAFMLLATALPATAQSNRPSAEPRQAQRQATVQNSSQQTITEIYSSPTSDNDWGPDRLGSEVLAAGNSHRIRYGRTSECRFDFKVVYDNGAIEEQRSVDICRNSTVAFDGSNAVSRSGRRQRGNAGGEQHSVELTNGFERTIYAAYMTDEEDPSDTTAELSWSDDLFGSNMLEAGNSLTLNYTGQCVVRLRIVFDNFAAEERTGINICDGAKITVRPGWTTSENFETDPSPQDQANATGRNSFRLVNRTGEEILIVYANRDGAGRGPDRLGSNTLPDEETFDIRVGSIRSDRCLYTVTIVYASDRSDETRTGINLCTTEELVIEDGWTSADLSAPRAPRAASAPNARNSFRLVNRTGEEILIVHANRDGTGRGPDRLGSSTLPDGQTFNVRVGRMDPAQCLYTVTIVYSGSRSDETRTGINLCAMEELVIQDGWTNAALPSRGAIRNGSTTPIVQLFVHRPNEPRGEDRLANGTLGAGATFHVPPAGGQCQYQVVGIFRDGRQASTTADLCKPEGVTLQ